ncbi:MAG: hypothetical protein ABJH82_00445 [Polaribacter sp.]|uniref:hypothetical protein n=1 Tax=Polaribacter sp. TaxID=1920175 RepID=UPI003263E998
MKYTLIQNISKTPENISCTYFSPKEKLLDNIDVLIASFKGIYPEGSLGKNHATYISKKVISGLIDFDPEVIILDFRELTYNWGNSILSVFQEIKAFKDGENLPEEPAFPILVLVSERSKNGIISLLTPATSNTIPNYIFEDINKVIKEAEKRGKYWLDN